MTITLKISSCLLALIVMHWSLPVYAAASAGGIDDDVRRRSLQRQPANLPLPEAQQTHFSFEEKTFDLQHPKEAIAGFRALSKLAPEDLLSKLLLAYGLETYGTESEVHEALQIYKTLGETEGEGIKSIVRSVALNNLAYMLETNRGIIEFDHDEALREAGRIYKENQMAGSWAAFNWVRFRATHLNDLEQKYNLATYYTEREIVPASPDKAFYWFKAVADDERSETDREIVARAQYHVGTAFINGNGVPEDKELGQEYIRKSADYKFGLSREEELDEVPYDCSSAYPDKRMERQSDWTPIGLATDGGGARGLIPAIMATNIIEKTNFPMHKIFDIVGGSSIGGILSLGFAATLDGVSPLIEPPECINLFRTYGSQIFNKRRWIGARHDSTDLELLLYYYFKDSTIDQTLMPVVVTGVDHYSSNALIFSSLDAKENPEHNFYCRSVARGTSAAPTYFPSAVFDNVPGTNRYTVIDGGIGQNNPSIFVEVELRTLFPERDYRVLSLATGQVSTNYTPALDAGMIGWMKGRGTIVNTAMDSSADFATLALRRLSERKAVRYERIVPDLTDVPIGTELDSCREEILDLYTEAAHASYDWEHSEFIRWLAENTARKRPGEM